MFVGYARTSTFEQEAGLEAQERDLKAAGCERTYKERVSSVALRTELESALNFIREGDVLVVTKLDRLARSVVHLGEVVRRIEDCGASLKILSMNIDTSEATGRLMLNIFGSVAQFEREMMLERQREGIAKAKAAGKYKGRKPTARNKSDDIVRLFSEGVGPTEISKRLNIGRASVYRILAEQKI